MIVYVFDHEVLQKKKKTSNVIRAKTNSHSTMDTAVGCLSISNYHNTFCFKSAAENVLIINSSVAEFSWKL